MAILNCSECHSTCKNYPQIKVSNPSSTELYWEQNFYICKRCADSEGEQAEQDNNKYELNSMME